MKSCHLLYFTHFNVYFLILYIWSRPFLHPNLTITLHLYRAYLPEAHRATSESMPLWKVLINKKEVLSSHVLAGAGSCVCHRLVIVRWAACHSSTAAQEEQTWDDFATWSQACHQPFAFKCDSGRCFLSAENYPGCWLTFMAPGVPEIFLLITSLFGSSVCHREDNLLKF